MVSQTSIRSIATKQVEMCKACAHWEPRQITDDLKMRRMSAALNFLTQYTLEGESLRDRVVTGDKTWIHRWTSATKRLTMVWKITEEPAPQKFKTQSSERKVMATVF